jgi:hypothetical protein
MSLAITPPVITFNGADGAGKTSLIGATTEVLRENSMDCFVLSGMRYAEWDRPNFINQADDLMGPWRGIEDPAEPIRMPSGQTLTLHDAQTMTFQFIANRCYTRAQEIRAEAGSFVLIDSDPYLKGLMWALIREEDENIPSWHQAVGPTSNMPEKIVNVRASLDRRTAASMSLKRVLSRPGGLSVFDPKNDAEALRRVHAAEAALSEAVMANTSVDVITVVNAQTEESEVNYHLARIAKAIISVIARPN